MVALLYTNMYPLLLLYGAPIIKVDRIFDYMSPTEWLKLLLNMGTILMGTQKIKQLLGPAEKNLDTPTLNLIAENSKMLIATLATVRDENVSDVLHYAFNGEAQSAASNFKNIRGTQPLFNVSRTASFNNEGPPLIAATVGGSGRPPRRTPAQAAADAAAAAAQEVAELEEEDERLQQQAEAARQELAQHQARPIMEVLGRGPGPQAPPGMRNVRRPPAAAAAAAAAEEGSDSEGSDGEGSDGEGSEGEGSDGEGSVIEVKTASAARAELGGVVQNLLGKTTVEHASVQDFLAADPMMMTNPKKVVKAYQAFAEATVELTATRAYTEQQLKSFALDKVTLSLGTALTAFSETVSTEADFMRRVVNMPVSGKNFGANLENVRSAIRREIDRYAAQAPESGANILKWLRQCHALSSKDSLFETIERTETFKSEKGWENTIQIIQFVMTLAIGMTAWYYAEQVMTKDWAPAAGTVYKAGMAAAEQLNPTVLAERAARASAAAAQNAAAQAASATAQAAQAAEAAWAAAPWYTKATRGVVRGIGGIANIGSAVGRGLGRLVTSPMEGLAEGAGKAAGVGVQAALQSSGAAAGAQALGNAARAGLSTLSHGVYYGAQSFAWARGFMFNFELASFQLGWVILAITAAAALFQVIVAFARGTAAQRRLAKLSLRVRQVYMLACIQEFQNAMVNQCHALRMTLMQGGDRATAQIRTELLGLGNDGIMALFRVTQDEFYTRLADQSATENAAGLRKLMGSEQRKVFLQHIEDMKEGSSAHLKTILDGLIAPVKEAQDEAKALARRAARAAEQGVAAAAEGTGSMLYHTPGYMKGLAERGSAAGAAAAVEAGKFVLSTGGQLAGYVGSGLATGARLTAAAALAAAGAPPSVPIALAAGALQAQAPQILAELGPGAAAQRGRVQQRQLLVNQRSAEAENAAFRREQELAAQQHEVALLGQQEAAAAARKRMANGVPRPGAPAPTPAPPRSGAAPPRSAAPPSGPALRLRSGAPAPAAAASLEKAPNANGNSGANRNPGANGNPRAPSAPPPAARAAALPPRRVMPARSVKKPNNKAGNKKDGGKRRTVKRSRTIRYTRRR